jgi:hypothetical protein
MGFSIKLQTPTEDECGYKECRGVIAMGDFQETFIAPLEYWSVEDYQRHWKVALERALKHKDSCLITSLYDPQTANFIWWWILYNHNDKVIIQNQGLLLDTLSRPFTPDAPYSFIPRYESESEEGEKYSEWVVPIRDIEVFLAEYENRCLSEIYKGK